MRAIGIAALIALSGCSLVFMETLPDNYTTAQEPRCTTSAGWPLWDLLIAGTNLVVGAASFIQSERLLSEYSEDDPRDEDDISDVKKQRNTAMLLSGSVAVVYGSSMVYGLRQSSKCKEARAARDAYQRSGSGAERSR